MVLVSAAVSRQGGLNGASSFNQPLNKWNVSKVTYMRFMFLDAKSFNKPLNKWNVSNVEDMLSMFQNCEDFNQPLNNWNVSNVEDMENMFQNARSFNQPLHAPWYVGNVCASKHERNLLELFGLRFSNILNGR